MATSKVARAFGREVRRRRHAQGMTLHALSAGSGLTPNYIGEIEAGKRDPSITTVAKLASGLGTPLGELLGLPDMPAETIEAARLLSKLPRDVRETLTEALRSLVIWAERRRA